MTPQIRVFLLDFWGQLQENIWIRQPPWGAVSTWKPSIMAVPLEQFVKQLEDSGILAGDTLQEFLPPKSDPKNAEELARELVRKNKLTKFQAEEVYRGKGKSLVLGNYVLMEKIGAGGMGQVFKARHLRMDRLVAVKLLPASMTKDPAAIARFEREVKAAARLRHSNIVAADDADQAKGHHFLVMELVEGSDLSALVKKHGALSIEKGVNYVLQAAKGLEFAHSEGVVHRDIKPANLLLDKKGTVKILDMGLARLESVGDAAGQAELTNTGTVMGTVDFMAPEQALNTKAADARADIYSLGCSLYYMLTGKATYDGDTLMAKLLAHRDQPIPSIRASRPEVPEAVESVFCKMVAKKIEDRYQTMTELIADLESLKKGHSESINTPSSFGSSIDTGLTNFLKDISLAEPPVVRRKKGKRVQGSFWKDNKKNLLIGGGILGGLILLAGIVISLRTKDGTLVVNVNESDADVQVLNEEGKVEITRKSDKGPITISVVPGKHQLKVQKDGFELFTDNFEIKSAGKESISAKLVALKKTAMIVENQPANQPGNRLATKAPPNDAAVLNGHSYKFFPDVLTWHQAKDRCEEMGGHLAVIETDEENNFLAAFAEKSIPKRHDLDGVWVGATDEHKEGEWKWTNGNPLAFTKWGPGQPNNKQNEEHYLMLFLQTHEWSDQPDRSVQHTVYFVCEWDSTPGQSWDSPDFRKWMTEVQAMPAEKQVEAVSKKLVELNPGFDGKLTDPEGKTSFIEDGRVARLRFTTDHVTNISPVRAFTRLYSLDCTGSGSENGRLSDLSPLKGMGLGSLSVSRTNVSDLSALKGMDLSFFSCDSTLVSDISPLSGMPLAIVNFHHTKVADLSPLSGSRESLKSLVFSETPVSDVSPLEGMKLIQLAFTPKNITKGMDVIRNIKSIESLGTRGWSEFTAEEFWKKYDAGDFGKPTAPDKPIADFNSPAFQQWVKDVQALPAEKQVEAVSKKLVELNPGFDGKLTGIGNTANPKIENGVVTEIKLASDSLTDLSPLRALTGLRYLECSGSVAKKSRIADLSPLQGLPLKALYCSDSDVSDLSPIRGMKLEALACARTAVGDLSPLIGMPLGFVHISGTNVTDLSPLRAMPLYFLACDNSKVTTLESLQGIKLTHLNCTGTKVADLSPLREMKLVEFYCSETKVTNLSPLKGMLLERFECWNSTVSDLTPLKGMPLKHLKCQDSAVFDLTPLQGMNLAELYLTPRNVTKGINAIRQMKSLQTIGIDNRANFQFPPDEFWKKFDAGEFGKPVAFNTPAFQQWVKDVQAMPAEKQVEAVSKKLVELNPGFDGKLANNFGVDSPVITNGMVTMMSFTTDHVMDVSSVRALAGLDFLSCRGSSLERGKLRDLSPLKGMTMSFFDCSYNPRLSDLSPLKGMPMAFLTFNHTPISDLSPLKGMPLEDLNVSVTNVSDLSPLEGMNLKIFVFTPNAVTKGVDVVRQMKNLKTIGTGHDQTLPAEEFWKKYDAGEFAKPQ